MRTLALAALAMLLSGCANMGYYLQSVRGQLDIWSRERPVSEVISDPATPAALKSKLEAVLRIRAYASRELGLPDNASYRRYADLGRRFVVWNVFAAPEFSVKPVRWCFLFAGCVSYRGYFGKDEADRYAADLAGAGDDVFVSGVPAYSTLGWFADPVLNTFVQYPEVEIARLIFHELAHQVVYVRDDSVFNESFAVTVEEDGVERWLESTGSAADRATYTRMQHYRKGFLHLVEAYRARLDRLYHSGLAADAMRSRKAQILEGLEKDYGKLKAEWGGFRGYDLWFAQRPNNAHLASVAIYTRFVPAFRALLKEEGGSLPRFFEAVKAIARLDKHARTAELERRMPHAAAPGHP